MKITQKRTFEHLLKPAQPSPSHLFPLRDPSCLRNFVFTSPLTPSPKAQYAAPNTAPRPKKYAHPNDGRSPPSPPSG
jgi:hypothetical protein